MLYLPVAARQANRVLVYELIYIMLGFCLYRGLLPTMDCFDPDLPDNVFQCGFEKIFILMGIDFSIFLVDLYGHSNLPGVPRLHIHFIGGIPIPLNPFVPWWAWSLHTPALEAGEKAIIMDELIIIAGVFGMKIIEDGSSEGGPLSLALIEASYLVHFLFVRSFLFLCLTWGIPIVGLMILLTAVATVALLLLVVFALMILKDYLNLSVTLLILAALGLLYFYNSSLVQYD